MFVITIPVRALLICFHEDSDGYKATTNEETTSFENNLLNISSSSAFLKLQYILPYFHHPNFTNKIFVLIYPLWKISEMYWRRNPNMLLERNELISP